jgi:serine/threonine protein kinase
MMDKDRTEIKALIENAGKYDLQDENCQGMNAYAFSAKHIPLNRNVFLKIYDASSERSDIFEEPRFLVEATSGGTNGSNHLVNVLDAEKLSEDWVLVAMEYVEGGSLLDAISQGPLPLMDAVNVTKDLLIGLSHLHNSSFVHRDIKPANVMLTNNNGRLHPKLGDFGSVARIENTDSLIAASRHSALYVPPEGWQQPSQYGIRSDLYQAGVVFAELLNGNLPYNEEPYLDRQAKTEIKKLGATCLSELQGWDRCKVIDEAIARRAASRKILSIVADQPYVNRTLKQIINTATNPEYSNRYSSANDMINAFNNLHFPNWQADGNVYGANAWNNWDWQVETVTKRSGTEIHIKRSRTGCDIFRRWQTTNMLPEAFNKVLREAN